MDSLCVCVRMCSAHGQEKNEKVEIAMESVGEGGSVCVSACVYIYIYFKRKKGHNYIFPTSLFRESLHHLDISLTI